MIVYADTSTLLKRVVDEPGAVTTRSALREYAASDDLATSTLAGVEVSRALRRLATRTGTAVRHDAIEVALSGIAERPIDSDVVALTRGVGPGSLRSLDAIHLATAVLIDADLLLTHDARLADAAAEGGLAVRQPRTCAAMTARGMAHAPEGCTRQLGSSKLRRRWPRPWRPRWCIAGRG